MNVIAHWEVYSDNLIKQTIKDNRLDWWFPIKEEALLNPYLMVVWDNMIIAEEY